MEGAKHSFKVSREGKFASRQRAKKRSIGCQWPDLRVRIRTVRGAKRGIRTAGEGDSRGTGVLKVGGGVGLGKYFSSDKPVL